VAAPAPAQPIWNPKIKMGSRMIFTSVPRVVQNNGVLQQNGREITRAKVCDVMITKYRWIVSNGVMLGRLVQ